METRKYRGLVRVPQQLVAVELETREKKERNPLSPRMDVRGGALLIGIITESFFSLKSISVFSMYLPTYLKTNQQFTFFLKPPLSPLQRHRYHNPISDPKSGYSSFRTETASLFPFFSMNRRRCISTKYTYPTPFLHTPIPLSFHPSQETMQLSAFDSVQR